MTSPVRHRARWVAAIAAAIVLSLGGAPAASAGSGSGSSGSGSSGSGGGGAVSVTSDFALSANYQASSFFGRLVRGGLLTCALCTTSVEPRYPVTGFTTGWDSNSIGLASLGGFAGTVTISVTGLSEGVSSQTATTVTVPRRGSTSTPFRLLAAADAPLVDFTAVVIATGGGKTHTVALPVSVVDHLP